MEAPLYPPATAYVPPRRQSRLFTAKDTAIADLKASAQAWAIVLQEMPNIEARIGNPMLKPHLGNFSFQSLVQFGVVKQDALDRLDEKLRTLGPQ